MKKTLLFGTYAGVLSLGILLVSCQPEEIVPNNNGGQSFCGVTTDSTGVTNPNDTTWTNPGGGGTPTDTTWTGGGGSPNDTTWTGGGGNPNDTTWTGGGGSNPNDTLGNGGGTNPNDTLTWTNQFGSPN